MAKIATLTGRDCKVLLYIIEVSATINAVDNTFTITAEYYLDNTEQYGLYPIIPANQDANSSMTIAGQTQYFKAPVISGKGKHLLYTFVSNPIKAEDEIETKIHVGALHYCNDKIYIDATHYYNAGSNVQNFYDVTIAPIMRKSRSSIVGDIVLGENVNITVSPEISGTTHKIGYSCGGETTYFYEGNSENVPLTLPLDLSVHNTTGTTIEFQLITRTYYNGTTIGEVSRTYVCNIPEFIKPSCTVEVKDGEAVDGVRIFEKYGAYVQRKSRLNVVITPILAYDSPITTCSAVVNDATYVDEYEFETGVLKHSGEQFITVTLTDNRGRTGEVVIPFNVLEYSKPTVSNVDIYRCDADGTANASGDYLKVTFSAKITPLNNMNSASYKLEYQTTSGLDQNEKILTDYTGLYSVVNGTCIFSADNNSVYTAVITAIDDLDEGSKNSGHSLITVLMNIMASGLGIAFGTIAGLEKVFENAFKFYPSGGFMFPTLESGSDLYGIKTPNIYSVENGQDVAHSPTDDSYTLIVLPGGGIGDLLYIAITGTPEILIARITDSSWSSWYRIGMTEV